MHIHQLKYHQNPNRRLSFYYIVRCMPNNCQTWHCFMISWSVLTTLFSEYHKRWWCQNNITSLESWSGAYICNCLTQPIVVFGHTFRAFLDSPDRLDRSSAWTSSFRCRDPTYGNVISAIHCTNREVNLEASCHFLLFLYFVMFLEVVKKTGILVQHAMGSLCKRLMQLPWQIEDKVHNQNK